MLSNLYFVILFLCIKWTFANYNVLEGTSEPSRYNKRAVQWHKIWKKIVHHKNMYEKNLADPENVQLVDTDLIPARKAAIGHGNKSRRCSRNNKEYDDDAGVALANAFKKNNKSTSTQPSKKSSNVNKDILEKNTHSTHHPEKKCMFRRRIRIPFFFHKKKVTTTKTKTTTRRKQQKRKIFNFGCPKDSVTQENKATDVSFVPFDVKRSFHSHVSPLQSTVTEILTDSLINERPRMTPTRMIHNSRQFFQMNPVQAKLEHLETNLEEFGQVRDNMLHRKKRLTTYSTADLSFDIKRRQQKELDEIQKEIDDAQLLLPGFVALAYKTNKKNDNGQKKW